ncbi:hypothetical protein DACRYDRAFT_17762 [Dacryopinax primogenitus]|uniref:DUF6593 domain-containing protein n=1 Tax=Dacryopinax primogenitus (strain DJM 731) TaxID=1858805 RepID=M5FUH6_DACPD|nr:uncharacterized protein DACRYDRAFT_17762 [Dacryopinax primogenitus]EJT99129.1 hypothetical protein DACRYDRAFT_17762 [Dacryopinax primogenitus]
MSETAATNSAYIFRLSSPDLFNCILYTDAGAYYSINTTSDEVPTDLLTPPTSPTSPTFASPRKERSLRPQPGHVGEVITVRSARGIGEFVGSVRHARGQWEIVLGLPERGTAFGKFFGLRVWGKVMGKPRIRDADGGFWTWQNYRSGRELHLISPSGEVAAQFRPSDPDRIADPNAALIVYKCAFEIKELVIVSWLALERVQREAEEGGKGKGLGRKGSLKQAEWRTMSVGVRK